MKAIRIRLDNKDPQNQIFVEIENDLGQSISIGSFTQDDGDGFSTIRITPDDIISDDDISYSQIKVALGFVDEILSDAPEATDIHQAALLIRGAITNSVTFMADDDDKPTTHAHVEAQDGFCHKVCSCQENHPDRKKEKQKAKKYDTTKPLKVGDTLAFRFGRGTVITRKVLKITPSGRIRCRDYYLNPDLSIRGRAASAWVNAPYRAYRMTNELESEINHRRNVSTIKNVNTEELSNSALDAISSIIAAETAEPNHQPRTLEL